MIKSIQNPFLLKKKLKTDIKMKSKKLKPLLNICYYINIFMLIHVVFIIMAESYFDVLGKIQPNSKVEKVFIPVSRVRCNKPLDLAIT